jgi:fatty-acyl-CoA synthase
MYHSIGGIVAPGAALVGGGAVICREKFSAATFWGDVAESRATIFLYAGELCRHLLAGGPPTPEHVLRLAVGNGLSGDVWQAFQDRFAIPRILEFYTSSEGNFSLYNVEGKAGSIGRVPAFLARRFPIALVKLDIAAGRPMRANDGLCIAAARGETGEALGQIGDGLAPFEGYSDEGAAKEKILRDVFRPGDAWLRSGDLMRQDAQGFFYFVDRTGGLLCPDQLRPDAPVAAALRRR